MSLISSLFRGSKEAELGSSFERRANNKKPLLYFKVRGLKTAQ
jgi:hypothetical protein